MAYVNITVERHVDTIGRMRLFCAREPLTTSRRIERPTAGKLIRQAIEIECGQLSPSELREQINRLTITSTGEFDTKDELRAIASTLASERGFIFQAARLLTKYRLDDLPVNGLHVDVNTSIPVQLDDRLKDIQTWHVYADGISSACSSPDDAIKLIRNQAKSNLRCWDGRIDPTESRLLTVRLSLGLLGE